MNGSTHPINLSLSSLASGSERTKDKSNSNVILVKVKSLDDNLVFFRGALALKLNKVKSKN